MFLPRCSELGLLDLDYATNILLDFSLPVKKILVREVSIFLLDQSTPVSLLSSPAHVHWAMETCGQGFSLPIDEEDSILRCVELYRRWALEPRNRPPPVADNLQLFMQKIMMHSSLLFAARSTDATVTERHTPICAKMLDIYTSIGRQVGTQLSAETWEIFLNLLLGIGDSLIRVALDSTRLGETLVVRYLSVLFELWLTSQTQNPVMWRSLYDRARLWVNVPFAGDHLVRQWTSTTLSLQDRAAAILYGGAANYGSPSVVLESPLRKETHEMKFSREFVFYAWHKTLHVLGNINNISHPNIFLTAILGVKDFVQHYIGVQNDGQVIPPDGNTLLHIFGQWLFQSALSCQRHGFEEGTAFAFSILLQIFQNRSATTTFLPIYLAQFYHSLQSVLLAEGRVLMTVLLESEEFFSHHLQGSFTLVPYFLYASTRVLSGKVKSFHPHPGHLIHQACLKILGNILCIPNHFSSVRVFFPEEVVIPEGGDMFKAENFGDLKPFIAQTILSAVNAETHATTIEQVLHLVSLYSFEDIENNTKFATSAITGIVNKITTITAGDASAASGSSTSVQKTGPSSWPPTVVCTGLRTLSSLSQLYLHLGEGGQPQARWIVSKLCRYLIDQLSVELPPGKASEPFEKEVSAIVAQCYYTITDWIMVDQWLFETDVIQLLIEAIVVGLEKHKPVPMETEPEKKDPKKQPKARGEDEKEKSGGRTVKSKSIRKASNYLLATVLNKLGNFPTPRVGTVSLSSLLTEQELLRQISEQGQALNIKIETRDILRSYLLYGNTILTIVERPFGLTPGQSSQESHPLRFNPLGPHITIFIRNQYGKYVWDLSLANLPIALRNVPSPTLELVSSPVPVTTSPFIPKTSQTPEGACNEILAFLDKRYKGNSIIDLAEAQRAAEEAIITSSRYFLAYPIAINPLAPNASDSGLLAASSSTSSEGGGAQFRPTPLGRAFIAQLGLFDLANWGKAEILESDSKFWNKIQVLDACHERVCHKIAVQYLPALTYNEDDTDCTLSSSDFRDFIASLGWGVDVSKHPHPGHLGGITTSHQSDGDSAAPTSLIVPVFANHRSDFVFHVSSILPSNSSTKHVLQSDLVRVVWLESRLDLYRISPKPSSPARILIHPLDNGLFHVRVLVTPSRDSSIGPLNSSAILSKHILASVIRDTAQSLHRFFSIHNNKIEHTPAEQLSTRRGIIKEVAQSWRSSGSVDVYYQGLFAGGGASVAPSTSKPSLLVPGFPSFTTSPSTEPTIASKSPSGSKVAESDNSSSRRNSRVLVSNAEQTPEEKPRKSSASRHRAGKERSTRTKDSSGPLDK